MRQLPQAESGLDDAMRRFVYALEYITWQLQLASLSRMEFKQTTGSCREARGPLCAMLNHRGVYVAIRRAEAK